jgi:hypothetical protein
MKIKFLLFAVVLFLASNVAFAQGKGGKGKKEGKEKSAEQRATNQSKHLTKQLGLDDTQRQKIYDITLASTKQVQEIRAKIKEINQGHKSQIEALLTDAQKIKWAEMKAKKQAEKGKGKGKMKKGKAPEKDADDDSDEDMD